jgi:hypothetical protein
MNRDQRSSSRSTCPGPRGGPLVPVRKQPELKAEAFSPTLLVPVATTRTNGHYKPGQIAFFPPVMHRDFWFVRIPSVQASTPYRSLTINKPRQKYPACMDSPVTTTIAGHDVTRQERGRPPRCRHNRPPDCATWPHIRISFYHTPSVSKYKMF